MTQEKLVLILGNGIAGTTAAFTARDSGFAGRIILTSEEPHPVYFRPRLPELLNGETTFEKIIMTDSAKHSQKNIELLLNKKAVKIDVGNKSVLFSDGEKIVYDKLVIATGCQVNIPKIKGLSEINDCFALRDASDADKIFNAAKGKHKFVCIGGGVLGLEAAYHIIKLGLKAEILECAPRLMPRQLDERGASILKKCLEEKGFVFSLGAEINEISRAERGLYVHLAESDKVSGDFLLLSTGVSPRRELLSGTDIRIERGITVDENAQTSVKDIYSAGDNVQFNGKTWGTWIAARFWGIRAGNHIAGKDLPFKLPSESFRLKITGIDLLSVGEADLENQLSGKNDFVSHIIEDSPEEGKYAKITTEKGLVKGAILLGSYPFVRNVEKAVQDNLQLEKLVEISGIKIKSSH
ncbi:MAG: NAD(P)/FAD-dependent oxidoreductase [Candidatus Riflebacteria bacterium]|nr:NAD(P)/FAD-dependent oxidoreductase [Candidatus Riflebacteria bacterium]